MIRIFINAFFLLILTIGSVQARDDRKTYSIEEAYKKLNIESQLGKVRLYFDGQAHPSVQQRMGEIRTNRKTNAFNKTDHYACQWVFFSALLALKDRAISDGGNAVINIKSNYKNQEFSSPTEYQCGVGAIIAGVALVGEVVRFGDGSSSTGRTSSSHRVSSSVKKKCSVKKVFELKSIGMTDAQIEQACSKPAKLSQYDTSIAKEAQLALSIKGYNVGAADGMWGGRSRAAMREFQESNNLTVTGELSDASLEALGIESRVSTKTTSRSKPSNKYNFSTNAKSTGSTSISSPSTVNQDKVSPANNDLFSTESITPLESEESTEREVKISSSVHTRIKVSLYSEPDPFSDIIVTIPKNVKLDVIVEGSEWVKVIYQGNAGYIVKAETQ